MFRKLSLSIVFLLAFLQCLAPLLHAHPLGVSAARGVHFHSGLDYASHGSPQTTSHADEQVATEYAAIGMEKPLKQDFHEVVESLFAAAVLPVFLVLFPLFSHPFGKGRRHTPPPHGLPFSQAPPSAL